MLLKTNFIMTTLGGATSGKNENRCNLYENVRNYLLITNITVKIVFIHVFIENSTKYGDKYFLICDKAGYIFRAGAVWPSQFENWASGLVNLFKFMLPVEWYNRGLVIVADKYFTTMDVVKFLGSVKTAIVGPILDIRIKRLFDKQYIDKTLKKPQKSTFQRKVLVLEHELPLSDQKVHFHILYDKLSKKPLPFVVSNITLLNNAQKTNCTIERLEGKNLAPIQLFYNKEMWPVDKIDQSMDNYSLIYQYKDNHWYRHQIHTVIDWVLVNGYSLYKSQVENPKTHTDFLEEVALDWIGRPAENFGLFGVQIPQPKMIRRVCHICPKPAKRSSLQCLHCHNFACANHAKDLRICQNCLNN